MSIVSPSPSFDCQERVNEIKGKLENFKQKMSLTGKIDLSLIGYKTPHADCKNQTISLPSWVLLKHEDIPPRFLIQDINDPRLVDERFLDDFAAWFNQTLTNSGLSAICRPVSNTPLQNLIFHLRDRNSFEKSKEFILAHELGHCLYNQQRKLPMGIIIAGIIALCLFLVAIPFVGLTIALIGAGVAVGITSVGILKFPRLSQVEQEKQADMDALAVVGHAQGGIYYFESELMVHRRLRFLGGEYLTEFDEKGNDPRNKSHPPMTERVGYLRQWQN